MRTYCAVLLATILTACGGGTPVANDSSAAAPKEPGAGAPAPADPTAAAEPTAAEPTAEPTAGEGEDEDGSCQGRTCVARCDAKGRKGDCLAAGEALREGKDGVAVDPAKAAKYLEKACTLKEREGCYALAEMLVGGVEGFAADDAKAVTLLVTACDLGRGQAATCSRSGPRPARA